MTEGVDRSTVTTVTSIVKTAKRGALDRLAASRPGRAGKSSAQVALEDAEAGSSGVGDDHRTGSGVASSPGKRVSGLMAGPAPARVSPGVKAGLLALIEMPPEAAGQ